MAFGGVSPEHEVSVLTALQAVSALKETSYHPVALYITKSGRWLTGDPLLELENYQDLKKLEAQATPCTFEIDETGRALLTETGKKGLFQKPEKTPIHTVLMSFHGSDGENGAFQGLMESLNLPYSGSGILGSSLGMDKWRAKIFCRANDIPVTDDVSFTETEWEKNQDSILKKVESLNWPVFVKPVHLGSSIGVIKCSDQKKLIESVETAFRYDARLIVEEAVHPLMEINCSVLGNEESAQASVCEQPISKEELLTFEEKYLSDGGDGKGMASADRRIPAPISDELTKQIQELSIRIFQTMDCSGVARLDFLINADSNKIYFNEINTIPGSFSFYLWDKTEISYPRLLERLISLAQDRHRQKNGRIRSYETNLLSKKSVQGIKGLKFRKS